MFDEDYKQYKQQRYRTAFDNSKNGKVKTTNNQRIRLHLEAKGLIAAYKGLDGAHPLEQIIDALLTGASIGYSHKIPLVMIMNCKAVNHMCHMFLIYMSLLDFIMAMVCKYVSFLKQVLMIVF